jgi:hypothetical protein
MPPGYLARASIHARNESLNIITFPLPCLRTQVFDRTFRDWSLVSACNAAQLRPRKGVFANSFYSIMLPNIKTFHLRSTSLLMESVAFDGDKGEWVWSESKSFDVRRGDGSEC